jgi:acetyl-CoA acetyltransferase
VGFASVAMTGDSAFTQNPNYLHTPGAEFAARRAFREAGVCVSELDFAQIYDCFTISCLMEVEDIGICGRGEAGAFFAEGRAAIGGQLPINTHGGLLSYSYLLGIEHLVEAVHQLRGTAGSSQVTGAELGLVSGFSIPDYGVLVLGSDSTAETGRAAASR